MKPCIITLNAGSSSLKFSLFSLGSEKIPQRIIYGQMEALDSTPQFLIKDNENKILNDQTFSDIKNTSYTDTHAFALQTIIDWLTRNMPQYNITAAGHRVVHGANIFTEPTIINDNIITDLEKFIPLAPLHQPYNIAGIKALKKINPELFQVACFDTSFHVTQSAVAQAFALPDNISDIPLKRYGFHGLSYEYIAQVLPHFMDETVANGKTIVAHLGHGASLCAMINRKSICTTMGFTALEGLPMGTRCGSLDPGVILYLLAAGNMDLNAITHLLYDHSGLLGVSGISSDVRVLLQISEKSAQKAIALFVYRIQREIGSLIAALGGLNNIVFTAGIGENSSVIRERVCAQFSWLGLTLNPQANQENVIQISAADSKIKVWVIPTNEELMIAQHVNFCLKR